MVDPAHGTAQRPTERLIRDRWGSVQPRLNGLEFGLEHVALRRSGRKRQTQPGGVDRGADVSAPVVGRHEVVEHPHRDLIGSPGPDKVPRSIGLDPGTPCEGIEQHGRVCAEVTDHEVARQTDAGDRDRRSASGFDVDDGQQYRQTATPREHEIEHRIARIVVTLSIADEPVSSADDLSAGACLGLWRSVSLLSCPRDLGTENVESRHRISHVDIAKLRRECQRQYIQGRSRIEGKLSEARHLRHARIVPLRRLNRFRALRGLKAHETEQEKR